jgi:hypothetical protein
VADVDLKLSERADSSATCVFCREALDDAPFTCPGCDVGLHAACRDELPKCPTLGCAKSWQRRGRVRLADEGARDEPLPGFRPAVVTGARNHRVIVPILLVALLVVGFLLAMSSPHGRDGAPGAPHTKIVATPLLVSTAEGSTWIGTFEPFAREVDVQAPPPEVQLFKLLTLTGEGNDLSVEGAQACMAGVRQRALAALPLAAADAWAQHGLGSSGRVRVHFDRQYPIGGGPLGHVRRATLEATITLEAIRDDAIDLRVAVTHDRTEVSWIETWPRAVAPGLRSSVRVEEDPAPTFFEGQGVHRAVRAVTAEGDGVTARVFQEDGLPLPWRATVVRGLDGPVTLRVELELLEWRPAQ